jgi:hypothetical protein
VPGTLDISPKFWDTPKTKWLLYTFLFLSRIEWSATVVLFVWEDFVDENLGVYQFVSIGEMAETITQLLALGLQHKTNLGGKRPGQQTTGLERIEQMILQQAKTYLGEVREGFVLSVHTTRVASHRELQYLLERILLDWTQLSRELGLEEGGSAPESELGQAPARVKRVRQQLLAFGMAATALGYLPHMAAEEITFPYSYSHPPTYSDIPAPDTPGEMLWRIEELEQMVWRLMSNSLQELVERRYGSLRRTYGFFESSALLANREAQRFGIKKPQHGVAWF